MKTAALFLGILYVLYGDDYVARGIRSELVRVGCSVARSFLRV